MAETRHRTVWSNLPSRPGYWDPITSTIVSLLFSRRPLARAQYSRIGEENYQYSYYVAETWNTWSNVVFMAMILFGGYKCWRQGLGSKYLLSHLLLMTVATGSFIFHMTLRWNWQLADELPMLATVTQMLETSKPGSPPKGGALLPISLTAVLLAVSAAYIHIGDPVFHQVVYAAALIGSVGRATYLLRTRLDQTPFEWKRNLVIRRNCKLGAFLFFLGFVIWNLDNVLCNHAQVYKDAWWPLASGFLEGHAIWHLFTGAAGVILVTNCHLLELSLKYGAENYELRWSYGVPWIKNLSGSKQD